MLTHFRPRTRWCLEQEWWAEWYPPTKRSIAIRTCCHKCQWRLHQWMRSIAVKNQKGPHQSRPKQHWPPIVLAQVLNPRRTPSQCFHFRTQGSKSHHKKSWHPRDWKFARDAQRLPCSAPPRHIQVRQPTFENRRTHLHLDSRSSSWLQCQRRNCLAESKAIWCRPLGNWHNYHVPLPKKSRLPPLLLVPSSNMSLQVLNHSRSFG